MAESERIIKELEAEKLRLQEEVTKYIKQVQKLRTENESLTTERDELKDTCKDQKAEIKRLMYGLLNNVAAESLSHLDQIIIWPRTGSIPNGF